LLGVCTDIVPISSNWVVTRSDTKICRFE
jgi:hypothetical protein